MWQRALEALATAGGSTTRLHALADGLGRLVAFTITPGQRGDASVAELIDPLPASATLAANRAYGKYRHPFDRTASERRNLVERAFCRIENFCRVAIRYGKLSATYTAAISLAAPGIGITRGGRTTKRHGLTDTIGRPCILLISPGSASDMKVEPDLIEAAAGASTPSSLTGA